MKAPAKLTYKVVPREPLIAKLISGFETDAVNKRLSVPDYSKEFVAWTAKTADNRVAGQLVGYTAWAEMHVDLLAADPNVNVKGVGTSLIHTAEALGRERGCRRIALDTYSWQARPFYEKLGFKVFAEHKDYPIGHAKYFMEKVFEKDSQVFELPDTIRASGLKVVPSDNVEASEKWLYDTLDNDTQSRKIPGVAPYVKTEYSLEAQLPDGTYAGGTAFETLWNQLHVSYFGVNTDLLGCGVGGVMLKHLESVAREHNCNRMALETLSWQAQPFYERHGFKAVGIQEDYPPGFSRIYLEKML